jgi:hypothetical protein
MPVISKPGAAEASAGTAIDPIQVRIREAVRVSGFSRSTLYLMAARGEVVFRKSGKTVLVDFASLKAASEALPIATIRIAG